MLNVPKTRGGQNHNRNHRREKKLWHNGKNHTPSLGCSVCPDRKMCGGLLIERDLYHCLDICCDNPEKCDAVCRNKPREFAQRVREINGFHLDNIPHAVRLSEPPVPSVVPAGDASGAFGDAGVCQLGVLGYFFGGSRWGMLSREFFMPEHGVERQEKAVDPERAKALPVMAEYLGGNEMLYVLDRAYRYLEDENEDGMEEVSVETALGFGVYRNACKGGMPDEGKALAHALACVQEAVGGREFGKADVREAKERVTDEGSGRLLEDSLVRMEKDGSLGVRGALEIATNHACVNFHHIQPLRMGNCALHMVEEACGVRLGVENELRHGGNLLEDLRKADVEKVLEEISERQERRPPAMQRVAAEKSKDLLELHSIEAEYWRDFSGGRGR